LCETSIESKPKHRLEEADADLAVDRRETPLDMREEQMALTQPSLVMTTSLPRCTPQMRVGAVNMSTR
jgi:hypothetical protein